VQQHRHQQQQQQPGNSGDGGSARNGHRQGSLPLWGGLEALVYHPTDSVMKPIVGNKRCARCAPVHARPLKGMPMFRWLFNPYNVAG
jgi:hypothetical protein